MSLINDMLKDLDDRGQDKPSFVGSDTVTPVEDAVQPQRPRLPWKLIIGCVFIALVVGVFWQDAQRILALSELRADRISAHTTPNTQNNDQPASTDSTENLEALEALEADTELTTAEVSAANKTVTLEVQEASPKQEPSPKLTDLNIADSSPTVSIDVLEEQPIEPELVEAQWQIEDNKGKLVLTLSEPSKVRVLAQKSDEMSVQFQGLSLSTLLPAEPKQLLQSFAINVEASGLMVSLVTQRAAEFSMADKRLDDGRSQVTLGFELSAAAVLPAEPMAAKTKKTVKPKPEEVDVISPKVVEASAKVSTIKVKEPETKAVTKPASLKSAPAKQIAAKQTTAKQTTAKQTTAASAQKPVAEKPAAPTTLNPTKAQVPIAKPSIAQPLSSDIAIERQAKRLLNQGDVGAAETLLKSTLAQAPSYLRSRALLSGIYITQGNVTLAHAQLDDGLNYNPSAPKLLELKARLAVSKNDWAQALSYLEQSSPSVGDMPSYVGLKASALQNVGRMEESARLYYALLENDRTQASYWVGLGYALENLGRLDEAREAYQSSLHIPQGDSALRNFANARLSSLGQ